MYRGEVNINQEDLNTFLAAAEELRVRGLSQSDLQDRMEDRANISTQSTAAGDNFFTVCYRVRPSLVVAPL